MRFVLCDGSAVNSYGFRTSLDGMVLDRFKENPVMLNSHCSDEVIGRWNNIAVEDGRLTADAEFDLDDEHAKAIAGKVERGFLKGCSIGMIVKDMREVDGCLVATVSELLEASICAIPADAHAIRLYDEQRRELSMEDVRLRFLTRDGDGAVTQNQINMSEKEKDVAELTAKVSTLTADIAERDKRIAELEAQVQQAHEREVETFLSAAVTDGRITEKEKEGFKKLAAADFDAVKELVSARPVKASASLAAMQAQAADTNGLAGKSWDELDKEGLLASLKADNPELYKKKFEEKFGK